MRRLPYGVVRVRGGAPQPALRDGDDALLLGAARAPGGPRPRARRRRGRSQRAHRARARRLGRPCRTPPPTRRPPPAPRCATATAVLPVRVPDFVDFYASLEHATNFGRIFRPGTPPVRDNWRHMPIGYHGRASTIVVSGSEIRRPHGQTALGALAPTQQLDLECELGYVCGPSAGGPVAIDRAAEHIFGVVLVNDWSARDVQRLEYEPLGPFLGKSFATSMSAWITPLRALDGARLAPPPQDPPPARYLAAQDPWQLDVELEIELNGRVVSRPRAPACTGRRRKCSPT